MELSNVLSSFYDRHYRPLLVQHKNSMLMEYINESKQFEFRDKSDDLCLVCLNPLLGHVCNICDSCSTAVCKSCVADLVTKFGTACPICRESIVQQIPVPAAITKDMLVQGVDAVVNEHCSSEYLLNRWEEQSTSPVIRRIIAD